jgi:aminoglycoside 6-adenylyltransferase
MDSSAATYDALLARITTWAKVEPNIRAVAVFGSQARQDDPADEWSDLDLALVAKRPAVYLADDQWLGRLGPLWLSHYVRAPVGGLDEQRAVFDGALELDVVVLPVRKLQLARLALGIVSRIPAAAGLLPIGFRRALAGMAESFGHGARILVDKDGLLRPLPSTQLEIQESTKPTEKQFLAVAEGFWHGSIWVAKHLRRGELWRAKDGCDARMKMSILQLAEWHTKAIKGWSFNTWAQGRFLERWADPRIVAALGDAFARYEVEDVWRALFATMALFRWLGCETAAKLDLTYPTFAEEHATEWVNRCFAERESVPCVRSGSIKLGASGTKNSGRG